LKENVRVPVIHRNVIEELIQNYAVALLSCFGHMLRFSVPNLSKIAF
jgi:hypothetical protein